MAESGLTLSLADLRNEAAIYVFGGSVAGSYSSLAANEQTFVNGLVKIGLRRFYTPPPVNGRRHDWSFLKVVSRIEINAPYITGTIAYDHTGGANERQITLTGGTWPTWAASAVIEIDGVDYEVATRVSGTILTLESYSNPGVDVAAGETFSLHQDDYDLPDDFGYIQGEITFEQKDNAWYICKVIPEERIRDLRMRDYNQNFNTGEPQVAAIRPKRNVDLTGSRSEILFWPSITAATTAVYRYRVRPDSLGDAAGYPWGASDHSETIRLSVLAACEESVDQRMGEKWAMFQNYLAASIDYDSKANRPQVIGYNADYSDGVDAFGHSRHRIYGVNSANGVNYIGQGF